MKEARNYPDQEETVFNHFKENTQVIENLTAPLYEEKVVDFILELASVKKEGSTRQMYRYLRKR